MHSECTANAQRLRRRETVILMSSEVVLLVYLVSVFVLLVDQLLLLSLSLLLPLLTATPTDQIKATLGHRL